jgi:hypothetical protein
VLIDKIQDAEQISSVLSDDWSDIGRVFTSEQLDVIIENIKMMKNTKLQALKSVFQDSDESEIGITACLICHNNFKKNDYIIYRSECPTHLIHVSCHDEWYKDKPQKQCLVCTKKIKHVKYITYG